ncbi:hypothetical protein [Synechococcus sp. UW140]|uniref:hypothetical protein n=1 Tax=Synechococcus sp. UW140 TaxID=368503 RepID=UPI000E0FC7CC|nr:hypothetical protein [Synechococcus sp. UW140]
MARGHWLDPLARKVLQAVGELPPDPPNQGANPSPAPVKPSVPSWVIDVNRATAEHWRQLPGCSEEMIDLLLRLQRGGVQFSQADDLFQLLDLPAQKAEDWRPHLIFHWYGDAPPLPEATNLDLNGASAQELEQSLHWPEQRLTLFLKERIRRPFHNLADLQERLCLPPETVEQLLGKVRFGDRRPGPSLPPRH